MIDATLNLLMMGCLMALFLCGLSLSLYTLVASWDFRILLRLGCFGAFLWQLCTVLFVFELIN